MPRNHPLRQWTKQNDSNYDSKTTRRVVYFESHASENGRSGHFIVHYQRLDDYQGWEGKADGK